MPFVAALKEQDGVKMVAQEAIEDNVITTSGDSSSPVSSAGGPSKAADAQPAQSLPLQLHSRLSAAAHPFSPAVRTGPKQPVGAAAQPAPEQATPPSRRVPSDSEGAPTPRATSWALQRNSSGGSYGSSVTGGNVTPRPSVSGGGSSEDCPSPFSAAATRLAPLASSSGGWAQAAGAVHSSGVGASAAVGGVERSPSAGVNAALSWDGVIDSDEEYGSDARPRGVGTRKRGCRKRGKGGKKSNALQAGA